MNTRTKKSDVKKTVKKITNYNELIQSEYGKRGSTSRVEFEIKANAYMIGELLRDARRHSKMTQEQLADKIGSKKSFISRIENGKVDIQLSTLYRIIEQGIEKKLHISF
jgi:HTH-type transcriptional regulator/antitoxin HipB